ncbi:MAG: GNAT family N-acetyltransferase [candidate division Zixibacteria bacterium]|nr:GNAT family N-acetyltransferase [candidate division Zixibacteria bacterium]
MLIFTTHKKRLRDHFKKNPVLFAYHTGDLDDPHFPHCQWGALFGRYSKIDEVVLTYTGLSNPTVLAFGVSERFAELLDEMLPLLPNRFHGHFQAQHRDRFTAWYDEEPMGHHFKMKLGRFTPVAFKNDNVSVRRLGPKDADELIEFYRSAYPDGFFEPRMLQSSRFLGAMVDSRLAAVTGVHVHSPDYGVAVLGCIATHPDFRGQGLATGLTSRLLEELTGDVDLICLNVYSGNTPAIRSYEKLGFSVVHEYEEAFFTRKEDPAA